MSVNPSSGFEWIEFLKVSPHPMKWKFMGAYCGNKFNDDDILRICLGMLSSWLHAHQLHILLTSSSHPICQVARPHFVTSCQVPIAKSCSQMWRLSKK
jgi:hypothetical protein